MNFNFHFAMPQGSKSFPIKALFTGKAVADGATYYMPLFPCTTNMAEVPAMTISVLRCAPVSPDAPRNR